MEPRTFPRRHLSRGYEPRHPNLHLRTQSIHPCIILVFSIKSAASNETETATVATLCRASTKNYGIDIEGDFDQIKSFRRFLLFARDTIKFRRPMEPDIHWSAMAGHASTLVVNGGHYDAIVTVENFKEDMKSVMSRIPAKHDLDIDTMPRFNESEGPRPQTRAPP